MIKIRFEYWCDACGREAMGADEHRHGADYGRYPVPRSIRKVGQYHVCGTCYEKAERALQPITPPVEPHRAVFGR